MTIAVYTRVSTDDQTIENQLIVLHDEAVRRKWIKPDGYLCVYSDEGISGRKGRDKRPAYDALLRDVSRRRVSRVAAWAIDRLGRSMFELVWFFNEIGRKKCGLYLHQQQVDTSTPGGRAFLHMAMVFAEFESSMIGERVKAGMARAKAEGRKVGRFPALSEDKQRRIRDLLERGATVRAIAADVKCGHAPIQRIKKDMIFLRENQ